MKYNCEIQTLDLNSSHGKIISQIRAGSTVLECGCATGYMTKYMSQRLGACVSIVEYEQAAFDKALEFAEDGICADLTQDAWLEKFAGMKFDYILFADVLEHLYNPSAVLAKAVSLLKDDGSILVSLPNIAHNDVLLNLYCDDWRYTPLGLLDNTHIRFFSEKVLDRFFDQAGLSVVCQDYTRVGTMCSELRNEIYAQENPELLELLKKRPNGEIYQHIITAQRKEYVQTHGIQETRRRPEAARFLSNLFYATEQEPAFTEEKRFLRETRCGDQFFARYDLQKIDANGLRFDPVEGSFCVVKSLEIVSNAGVLSVKNLNGFSVDGCDVFATLDPQYFIDLCGKRPEWLEIRANIIPFQDTQLLKPLLSLQESFSEKRELASSLQSELASARTELSQSAERADRLQSELTSTKESLAQTEKLLIDAGDELAAAKTALAQSDKVLTKTQSELSSTQASLFQRDAHLADAQTELASTQDELHQANKLLSDTESMLASTKDHLKSMEASTCWRITSPLRWLMDRVRLFTA